MMVHSSSASGVISFLDLLSLSLQWTQAMASITAARDKAVKELENGLGGVPVGERIGWSPSWGTGHTQNVQCIHIQGGKKTRSDNKQIGHTQGLPA